MRTIQVEVMNWWESPSGSYRMVKVQLRAIVGKARHEIHKN